MNIMQVVPEMNVGGVETGVLDLSRQLVKMGHKVVVVSAGGVLVKELEEAGVRHYTLPVHKKSIFTIMRMISALCKIIEEEKIDIVHGRSRAPAWSAFFAARRTRRVFITTCHGYYSVHPFSAVMGWGKLVIALSNSIARHMIEDFGVPQERIRLIPRSVDLNKFNFISPKTKRKKQFNVGIIGRITPLKGHLVFIQAMAKLAEKVPNLKVWIVGDAPSSKESYKEQLKVLVKRLGLSEVVDFLGTQRDIPAILSQLDALVLATLTQEAFGRVIIEAQAAGVPVVATRVGGVVDIIEDGVNGLLVPPSDVEAMSSAVLKIFQDIELSERLAKKALEKIKDKYTLDNMVKDTLKVYEEALGQRKILVIKLSSLGDVILSTPALRALHKHFHQSHKISVLVGVECKDVLLRCPYIDDLIVIDHKAKDRRINRILRLGAQLRRQCFDILIDFQNNRLSHILAWLSLANERYGYHNGKFGFLLNRGIKNYLSDIPPVQHQFQILKLLGIELEDAHLELFPTVQDERYIESLLKEHWVSSPQKLAGINISASYRWQTKNWPIEHLVELCELLGRRNLRVVLTGTNKEVSLAYAIAARAKIFSPINLCGKTTVNQLACLIRRCCVYISSDSAPLHIAAAMDTPFVALFGPTDSRRHLPPAQKYVVLEKKIDCQPCYKPKCRQHKCMIDISPKEVLLAVESLLDKD